MRSTALRRRPVLALQSPLTRTTSCLHAQPQSRPFSATTCKASRLIRRPKRPYTFTQLIQQTDGSTYTHRTTSPHPLYKAVKDSRNHGLWQPSDKSLMNVEVDEAGKLALFRARFGREFDFAASPAETAQDGEGKAEDGVEEAGDDLSDLISGYVKDDPQVKKDSRVARKVVAKKKK